MSKLDKLFNPSSIAVIGATDKKEKVGYAIFKNIIDSGYKGKVFPVNRRLDFLEGYKVYHSVMEIQDKIDLAIVSIPIQYVPEVFDQLGKKGVEAAVVISAGGRETGKKGLEIEEKILEKAKRYGIRFLGPNCLGFANTTIDLNANFGLDKPLKGDTAFISQSGALFTAIMDWALEEKIGFSYAISIGNMADIEFGELIDYLGEKKEVKTILLYIESLRQAERFLNSARKVSQKIPIIAVKAGRSEAGQKAAASHTGALGGKDFLYSAFFKRSGVVRAENVLSLFDITEAISKQPLPEGNRFVVVTNAGGPGVMAADEFDKVGLKPAELSENTLKSLNSFLPQVWSHGNPVDIIGDASPERYRKTLEVLFDAEEVDGIICILTPQYMTKPFETAQQFLEVSRGRKKPFYSVLLGGKKLKKAKDLLEENNIPVFGTPEEAVDTMFFSYSYKELKDFVKEDRFFYKKDEEKYKKVRNFLEEKINKKNFLLTHYETKKILSIYGIPVNETYKTTSLEEALQYAEKVGYPVVLKVNSPDILHKTEAGGVISGIKNEEELKEAYTQILKSVKKYNPDADIHGITVEKEVKGDFELIVGSSFDKIFKQYIMFGAGGTLVEFVKDVSFDLLPLSDISALRLINSTKISKLLKNGYRNKKPVDIQRLMEIVLNVSRLLTDFPQIKELDINPLIAKEKEFYAVDGRIRLEDFEGKNTLFT